MNGLDLEISGEIKHLTGSVVSFSGDNLSCHYIFWWFSTCFSSGKKCRFCMAVQASIL